jgi:Uma2 family endonuclease
VIALRPLAGYNRVRRLTMTLTPTRRRFTVHDYGRMGQAGILTEDDRVELIDGEIIEMSPIGSRHVATVGRFSKRFEQRFGDVTLVFVQSPVRLAEHDEPEPDLALVKPRPDFYAAALPTPPVIFLLVEVADTSLDFDRRPKLPLYARHGIPEVWLVDVTTETILVSRDPTPSGYRTSWMVGRGDRIAPLAFPERELDGVELLG